MSLQTVAREFVDLCNQGRNFDVMRTMYAPDIVSVEGDGSETAGQQVRDLAGRQHDPLRAGARPTGARRVSAPAPRCAPETVQK